MSQVEDSRYQISPQDRALIDAHIAEKGVTVIPYGGTTFEHPVWDEKARILRNSDTTVSWYTAKKAKTKKRGKQHSPRGMTEAVRDRRERIVVEFHGRGLTLGYVADALEVSYETVKHDVRELRKSGKIEGGWK